MSARKASFYGHANDAERDSLILSNLTLVNRIASHLSARLPPFFAFDDLLQAGMVGLIEAARSFDPLNGAPFDSYARLRIKGAIVDYVRKQSMAPRSALANKKSHSQATTALAAKLGRAPTQSELAAHLNTTVNNLSREVWQVSQFSTTSTEDAADEIESIVDESEHSNPALALENSERISALAAAIEKLPERKQLVISLYYVEEMTMKEIGETVGISESRVSQILSETATALKEQIA